MTESRTTTTLYVTTANSDVIEANPGLPGQGLVPVPVAQSVERGGCPDLDTEMGQNMFGTHPQ